MSSLSGQKALIVGVANESSIACGCAQALMAQGADLAITLMARKAGRFVHPPIRDPGTEILMPPDVSKPE